MNRRITLLIYFLFIGLYVFPQHDADQYAIEDSLVVDIDIFTESQPAAITLKYDMKEFRKRQNSDKYLEADLIYHMSDSIDDRHRTVRVKARGKNRQEVCTFPPIWINIRKSGIENKNLEGTTKIKLVTHCGNSNNFQTYVMKEYLAYKIYNLISPYSFRVRLVRIKYIDTSRKNRETDSWAFLIEPEQMLADRLEMIPFKNDKVSMQHTDTSWTNTMTLFQYMIGNADYSIAGRHNVKLLRDGDHLSFNIIPVPYDFDYSGLVDAHYAVPGENLDISSVRDRYFLGPCRTPLEYQEVIDGLESMKESIFDLIESFEQLSDYQKLQITSYLKEFFENTNQSGFIERQISSTCR